MGRSCPGPGMEGDRRHGGSQGSVTQGYLVPTEKEDGWT